MPRGWSVHERAVRTLVTLVSEIAFVRTVFRDEFGRRWALADELLGIPPRARVSPCCFLRIAAHASELSLKMAAAYAGDTEVAPGRYKRGGLCLTCADEGADMFRERAWRMICENYEEGDVERTTNSHPAAFTDVRGTADRATVPQDGIRSLRSVRDASEIARRRVSLDGGARRGVPRQYALDSPEETAHPRGAPDGLLLRLLGIVGDASVAAKRAYRSNRGTRERPFVLPNRRDRALPDAGG